MRRARLDSQAAGTGYRLMSVTTSDEKVSVVVTGTDAIPDPEEIESHLNGQIYGMRVRVTAVPAQVYEFATKQAATP